MKIKIHMTHGEKFDRYLIKYQLIQVFVFNYCMHIKEW